MGLVKGVLIRIEVWINGDLEIPTNAYMCVPHAESIQHYMQDSYVADVREYGVTKSIHVEAEWLGDPVEETKCVCVCVCVVCVCVCVCVCVLCVCGVC